MTGLKQVKIGGRPVAYGARAFEHMEDLADQPLMSFLSKFGTTLEAGGFRFADARILVEAGMYQLDQSVTADDARDAIDAEGGIAEVFAKITPLLQSAFPQPGDPGASSGKKPKAAKGGTG